MKRTMVILNAALVSVWAGAATVNWTAEDVALSRRSKTVGPAGKGGLTLVSREVLQHEIGRTVHSRATVSAEQVGGSVVVKKEFVLDTVGAESAMLSAFTKGRLRVTLNGKDLPAYERLHTRSRPYNGVYPENKFPKDHNMFHMNGKPYQETWRGSWEQIPVDVSLLKKGANTFILRAKEGQTCRFLIEPSLYPDRSAVSRDGGMTWDSDRLSSAGNINGEYVVRLELGRHPAQGWIESDIVDLWPRLPAGPVNMPSVVESVRVHAATDRPWGTHVKVMARLGPTPVYDPAVWTPWCDVSELERGRSHGKPLSEMLCRFLQWRVELTASANRKKAPCVSSVQVSPKCRPRTGIMPPALKGIRLDQAPIVRPSHPFAHAHNTKRLKLLREQAGLDKLVEGKPRGIEQLLVLARWVKDTFGNNAEGKLLIDTNWDALMIWNNARGKDRLTGQMCTNRGAFFVQCAAALGYPARPCIWSHAVAEVWVDELRSWAAVDPSGPMYFEVNGKPGSMLAVARAWDGTREGTPKTAVRKVWGPKKKSKVQSNRNVAWFSRFWLPMRSNYLESPEPYEPGHGKQGFKFDGYLRWQHPHKEPLPWFSFYTTREGDIDFTAHTVNLHFAASPDSGTINVTVESDDPEPAHLEARMSGKDWVEVESVFPWKLVPGANALEVRSVNAFDVPGRVARANITLGQ